MARPSFSLVRSNYYSSNATKPNFVKREQVFQEIGFEAYDGNPNYNDTCAIRVSLALIKSGLYLPAGRSSHIIQKGPEKGKRIEVLQHALVEVLRRPDCLGVPDFEFDFPSRGADSNLIDAANKIGEKAGIISFYTWPEFPGGHIDLLYPENDLFECASSCHWSSVKIIFWELVG
jgi:hypothetical protein